MQDAPVDLGAPYDRYHEATKGGTAIGNDASAPDRFLLPDRASALSRLVCAVRLRAAFRFLPRCTSSYDCPQRG